MADEWGDRARSVGASINVLVCSSDGEDEAIELKGYGRPSINSTIAR